MKINGSALLEQRALRLAIVHLSRRDDLILTPSHDEYGIDLLVTLTQNEKISGRVFGVLVKASRFASAKAVDAAQQQFRLQVNIPTIPEDLPFPLALFVFNMEDDEGYFRWLLAPTSATRLALNRESIFTKLSPVTIDQAIAQVNRWYQLRSHEPLNPVADMVSV